MAKSSYLSWPRGGSAQWGKDPAGTILKNSFFGNQPSGSTLLLLGGRLAVGSATLPGAIQLVLSDSGYLKFLEEGEEPLSLSGGFITGIVNGESGSAPVNTVAPVISGLLPVGSVLSCTTGTWTGTPTPTYTYQWNKNGSPIGGATSSTYTTVSGDASANITCTVTATNASGSQNATSNTLVPTAASAGQVYQITPATLSNGYIGTGTVTFSNAFATALTPGNSVIVYTNVYHNSNAVPTAVTIGGASATKVSEQLVASNNTSAQVWIATVPSSPNRDITITVGTSSDSYPTVAGVECSPLAASPVDFDNVVPISSLTNPSITGEAATAQSRMLLLSQWGPLYGSSNLGSSGPSAGWVELSLQQDSSTYQGGAMAYRTTTAIETPTCSWTRTPAGDWFASIVALRFA